MSLDVLGFVLATIGSLATSWVFVSRLERTGERLGLSEASLGLLAALGADSPEITSSVTALLHGQKTVGSGVVLGSNVFNIAALLGLGAAIAGWVGLHRRVVILSGAVATWVATICLTMIVGLLGPVSALPLVLVVFLPYVTLTTRKGRTAPRRVLPPAWVAWINLAVTEEEEELEAAIRPRKGRALDAFVAGGAMVCVVGASILMERTGSSLGSHFSVPPIVVGALLLAAVTSLPNLVAAVYLASRGRGAAALSTTLNSNAFNVVAGMMIPAVAFGLPSAGVEGILPAAWYLGLTCLTLAIAYVKRGLGRSGGLAIIGCYATFVLLLLIV